jgi:ribosomal protein L12E/L44/L45/RPP1/RPP2
MNDEQRIRVLEEELKVLKNEIKSVLLDLREQYLNIQNPFNSSMSPNVAAGVGPQPEKPAAKAPVKETKPAAEEVVEEEPEEEPVMSGAGGDYEEEVPGSAPLDFGNSPEMPGFNNGNGDFGLAPGLPSGDPFGGAGAAPSLGAGPGPSAAPSMGAGPGPAAGPGQVDNTGDEDDEEEDDIPQVVVQPTKGGNKKKKEQQVLASGKVKYDLMVVAGLTQWIDQSTARLGKERAEALVEMSYTMGRLPENLKDVLIKMVRITKNESNGHNVTASDYLAILAQLENLLGKSEIQDNALLSLISMMKESK